MGRLGLGSFNKEIIQDGVGNALVDSASIDFTYNDAANTITATVIAGGVDHGGLAGLGDDDHTQYILVDGTRAFTGEQSMGSNKLTSVTDPTAAQDAATKNYVDTTVITDHGALGGLGDDDHTQYHNDTRGDARYYTETELDAGQLDNRYYTETELDAGQLDNRYYTETELDAGQLDNRYFTETEHIDTSAGAGDAGKPIKLDAAGHVDATMVNDADIDHGSVGGLGDDDHSQYFQVTGRSAEDLTITSADIHWSADGGGDIGNSGSNRPANIYATTLIQAGSSIALDGSQDVMTMDERGSAPTTPATGKWSLYAKSDGIYQIDDAGAETNLSSGGGGGADTALSNLASVQINTDLVFDDSASGDSTIKIDDEPTNDAVDAPTLTIQASNKTGGSSTGAGGDVVIKAGTDVGAAAPGKVRLQVGTIFCDWGSFTGLGAALDLNGLGGTVNIARNGTGFIAYDASTITLKDDVDLTATNACLDFTGGGQIGGATARRPFRANISTGGLVVGGSVAKAPDGMVEIVGSDTSASTKSLLVRSSTPADIFSVFNDGGVEIAKSNSTGGRKLSVFSQITAGDPTLATLQNNGAGSAGCGLTMISGRGTNATPASTQNGDRLGVIILRGFDGTTEADSHAIDFIATGAPTAGKVPGEIQFATTNSSGTKANRMVLHDSGGLVVGSPTGGDKGSGTINAEAVYDDNTLLTDFVFEDTYSQKSIDEMTQFYKEEKHLPTIDGRKVWDKEGRFSLGKISSQLWETVEVQAKYITELHERIKKLENTNG